MMKSLTFFALVITLQAVFLLKAYPQSKFDGVYQGQRTALAGSDPRCRSGHTSAWKVTNNKLTFQDANPNGPAFEGEVSADGSFAGTMKWRTASDHYTAFLTLEIKGKIAGQIITAEGSINTNCWYSYRLARVDQ